MRGQALPAGRAAVNRAHGLPLLACSAGPHPGHAAWAEALGSPAEAQSVVPTRKQVPAVN